MVDSQMLPRHGAHAAGVELCYRRGRRDTATGGKAVTGGASRQGRRDAAAVGRRRGTALGSVRAVLMLLAGEATTRWAGATGGDATAGALPGGRRDDVCERAVDGAR
jgi:hypothetical protein